MKYRRLRSSSTGLLALFGLFLATAAFAEAPTFESFMPGYSVARCHFVDGRLVLEHGGEFLVLRRGDRVPGRRSVLLREIDGTGATLVLSMEGRGEAASAREMVRLTPKAEGGIDVLVFSADGRLEQPMHPRLEDGGFAVLERDGTVRRLEAPEAPAADGEGAAGFEPVLQPELGDGAKAHGEGETP